MQISNLILSRTISEKNIFFGLFTNFSNNLIFWICTGIILVVQIIFIQFGNIFIGTTPLGLKEWGYCIGAAVCTLIWGFLLRLIPVPPLSNQQQQIDGPEVILR